MLGYISFLFTMTISFMGLLGVITRKFRFATSIYSGTPTSKLYKGKSAIFWGIIFFIGFGTFPTIIIINRIKEGANNDIFIYFFLTVISLLIAYLSRKHGIYKIRHSDLNPS